jgi:acyl carrier protein
MDMPEPTPDEVLKLVLSVRNDAAIAGSANLVEDGILDSFDIVLIVAEMERRYGIEIPGDAILPENFASITAILGLIVSRQTEAK